MLRQEFTGMTGLINTTGVLKKSKIAKQKEPVLNMIKLLMCSILKVYDKENPYTTCIEEKLYKALETLNKNDVLFKGEPSDNALLTEYHAEQLLKLYLQTEGYPDIFDKIITYNWRIMDFRKDINKDTDFFYKTYKDLHKKIYEANLSIISIDNSIYDRMELNQKIHTDVYGDTDGKGEFKKTLFSNHTILYRDNVYFRVVLLGRCVSHILALMTIYSDDTMNGSSIKKEMETFMEALKKSWYWHPIDEEIPLNVEEQEYFLTNMFLPISEKEEEEENPYEPSDPRYEQWNREHDINKEYETEIPTS